MQIQVILHSILREKLSPEARGRAVLKIQPGSRVQDILIELNLPPNIIWTVNGMIQRDPLQELQDGDELHFLRPGAGG